MIFNDQDMISDHIPNRSPAARLVLSDTEFMTSQVVRCLLSEKQRDLKQLAA